MRACQDRGHARTARRRRDRRLPGLPGRAARGTSASTACPCTRARTRSCAASGSTETVHPDFGSGRYEGRPIGIPYQVGRARRRSARASASSTPTSPTAGPYPIPRSAADRGRRRPPHAARPARHLPAVRAVRGASARQRLARRAAARSSTCARTRCARAAGRAPTPPGLPILPGLARYDEVAAGEIRHALRFTVSRTRRAFVFPARHFASSLTDPDLPAMGQRLRLKRGVEIDDAPAPGARSSRPRSSATGCSSPTTARTGSSPARPTRAGTTTTCARSSGCAGSDFEVVSEASRRA